MKTNLKPILVFVALVATGIVARVAFQDIPNFAPVAALSLFAGYYFRHVIVAACVPMLVMGVSDRLIDAGGYPWPLMLTVYGLLTFPVLLSILLRRLVDVGPAKQFARSTFAVGGFSLTSSLAFFIGTNAMVWATTSFYPPTIEGLVQCYVAAIPFFKYTLAGDFVFALGFFGALAVWRIAHPAQDRSVALAGK